MSSIIPRELAAEFERWELTSFDKKAPSRPRANPQISIPPNPPASPTLPEIPLEPPPLTEESLELPINLPTAEEIERIHNEAKAEGYEAGYAEGKKIGLEESLNASQAQVDRLVSVIDNLKAALNDLDQDLAEDVLGFAVEVARQVVSSSLQIRPDALLPVIREAMSALPIHHTTVMIHISPDDADLVRDHFGEQIQHAGWRVIEDKNIQPGGCYLRAGSSEVDATVHSRWRRALEAIGAIPEWLEPGP